LSIVLDTSVLVDPADRPDLAIAATAEEIGADLATRRLRHFPMFDGLRAPY
jgi:predicted nucleic acid-binding protein